MEKMTVFYQKSTGNIKNVATWETTIEDYFVDPNDVNDHLLIWDCIVVDYNETLMYNKDLFRVDIENRKIVLKKNEISF